MIRKPTEEKCSADPQQQTGGLSIPATLPLLHKWTLLINPFHIYKLQNTVMNFCYYDKRDYVVGDENETCESFFTPTNSPIFCTDFIKVDPIESIFYWLYFLDEEHWYTN